MSENKVFKALREEDRRTSTESGGSSGILRIVLIVGILVLLVWNLLFIEIDTGDEPEQPQSAAPDTPLTPSLGVEPQPAAPLVNEGSAGDGEQARQMIEEIQRQGSLNDPESLFVQAKEFIDQQQLADAYLLLLYLGKQGYGPASMKLAEMADPAFFDPNSSFLDAPSITMAHKWYMQSLMQGMREAEPRLNDLKLRVKAAAAGGDERARRQLVGW
jgi:hypothetical protein